MKQENVILDKSYAFGLRIVKLYIHTKKQQKPNTGYDY
jgi:hypothetical protein